MLCTKTSGTKSPYENLLSNKAFATIFADKIWPLFGIWFPAEVVREKQRQNVSRKKPKFLSKSATICNSIPAQKMPENARFQ